MYCFTSISGSRIRIYWIKVDCWIFAASGNNAQTNEVFKNLAVSSLQKKSQLSWRLWCVAEHGAGGTAHRRFRISEMWSKTIKISDTSYDTLNTNARKV